MRLRDVAADFVGEFIGTYLLVFFGCGSVTVAVLYLAFSGLFQVAAIWGIGVTLAIYATRHLSCAHLNPAVSIAMVVAKRMGVGKLPAYLAGQFLGALVAAAVLFLLFSSTITSFETSNAITRGTPESIKTAMLFGEFYPNPGNSLTTVVSTAQAASAEGVGTFLLVFLIFSLTEGCNIGRPDNAFAPVFIGLTVTIIICTIAPLTQAGLNPARDLSPRLFSYLAGWGKAASPDNNFGLIVYGLAPIFGASIAAICFTKIIEPIFLKKNYANSCCAESNPKQQ
ncbi:MAG: MIP/aquaporin family protein [Methylococcaceae bacterium]|nr:MIP/aquaporin family protein [Methylococcaceae bacterium]MDZ4157204.1 MIP/aquaporin family protein [Methylococcales bacterium]MDP2392493.1 MIP/aquaporin family protein [Methylococcaceae bacterium]MDP3020994.1 MIP/aquaporin family protein [Methylococcaceae bacterium]MDP3388381.1 MIP/aquaporin family protein [Methylococcaceae bacterium]